MEWTHWIYHSIIIVSLRFIHLFFVHSLILCLSTTILCQSLWKGLRPQQRMIGTINPCPHKAHSLGMGTEKEGNESVVMSGEGEMEGVWMLPDPERVVKKTQSYSAHCSSPRPLSLFLQYLLTVPSVLLPLTYSSPERPACFLFLKHVRLSDTQSLCTYYYSTWNTLPVFPHEWFAPHLLQTLTQISSHETSLATLLKLPNTHSLFSFFNFSHWYLSSSAMCMYWPTYLVGNSPTPPKCKALWE